MSSIGTSTSDGVVTRFAPSPTGYLHMGHAFSALFAADAAAEAGGRFRLRIEDIDQGRCRPAFETAILEDLHWLGLAWEEPVRRQSDHMDDYAAALARLDDKGLIYPCFCTRREIIESTTAPHGLEGPLYPGTCRGLRTEEREDRMAAGEPYAMRLDMAEALRRVEAPLIWHDRGQGEVVTTEAILTGEMGDVVLARKDVATSYHLSVTVDDALEGVTLVTRGQDLFHATHIHRLLQALLDLPTPVYHHHTLLVDETGRRLAKRHEDETLRSLRDKGVSAEELRARIAAHRTAAII